MPPYIEPASLPAFTRACQEMVREIVDEGSVQGCKPGEQLSAKTQELLAQDVWASESFRNREKSDNVATMLADNVIMVHVAWQDTPLYLQFSFRKTADTTEHSVALVPGLEAHIIYNIC